MRAAGELRHMPNGVESSWIDVSVPLRDGMLHWPGDPPVSITRVKDISKGNTANLSLMFMGTHSGTHVDAPVHFLADGKGIDQADISALVGRARVLDIANPASITVQELKRHRIRRGERVLFKTRNSSRAWHELPFKEDFVYLSDDAARFLADRAVRLVGVDYLSAGSYKWGGKQVHRSLLSSGVWLVEGLDLSAATAGSYFMLCLPLRVVDGDGAPARAVLRRIHPSSGSTSGVTHQGL